MLTPFELIFATARIYALRGVLQGIKHGTQLPGLVAEVHMGFYLDYHILVENTERGLVIVFTVFDNRKVVEYISYKMSKGGNSVSEIEKFKSDYRDGWTIRLAPM